ncbi:hypothetical protein [Mesobacillus foraminis]|uniref:hypothetical protein n=1 Tax=Mesobacillus foraminis TaxID=279826 RepID=UPI000EF4DA37|nr:hypothetical protein [Mesobacillus foraminis]
MKKRQWLLPVFSIAMLVGCSQTNASSEVDDEKEKAELNMAIKEKTQEIEEFNQKVNGLEKKIQSLDFENKHLSIIFNLTQKFVTANHKRH